METSKNNIVKLTIDLNNPPLITEEQKARLAALEAMPDSEIDYSDAPYLPNAVWTKAADRLPEVKKQITLRIDAEIIDYFKESGKRYQTRINSVLRAYMESDKKAHG